MSVNFNPVAKENVLVKPGFDPKAFNIIDAEAKKDLFEPAEKKEEAEKTGKVETWAKGFIQKALYGIPIVGSYMTGKKIAEQNNMQEALASGKEGKIEKPKFGQAWLEGFKMKLSQIVPLYGTYRIGKEIVEQKNIKKAIETGDGSLAQEKPKFGQAWLEGFKMKLSQIVPLYGTYRLGREIDGHEKLNKAV